MNLLVSGAALLTACAAFVAYDLATFRESLVRNLSVEAEIIGTNSVAALEFDDPATAGKTLSALSASPNIVSAGIYGPDGRLFAAYSRDGVEAPPAPATLGSERESHLFGANEVLLTRSIVFGGKRAGTVRIWSDLQSLYTRLRRFGFIADRSASRIVGLWEVHRRTDRALGGDCASGIPRQELLAAGIVCKD
jgi:hypothetical protein